MEDKVSKTNDVKPSKKKKIPPVEVTFDEKTSLLSMLYPKISPKSKSTNPKKKYACAVCKSSCDLYSLFLHMKEVHSGLLCCYCTKLFKKSSDLEIHIKTSHRVPKRYYHNTKQFSQISGQKYNFISMQSGETLSFKDLDKHAKSQSIKKIFDCPYCGRSFEAQKQLDMHLSNGWCKEMRWLTDPSKEDSQKIFKVLTGKDTDPSIFEKSEEQKTVSAVVATKKKSADHPPVKMTISQPPPSSLQPPQQHSIPLTESPQYNTYKKPKKEVKPKKASIMTQKEAIETKENTEQEKLSTSLKISIPLKKERKSERLARLSKEISGNFGKLRVLLDVLAESSTFCQQAHHVNVDAVFLLSHLMKTHDRQLIHKYLGEDAQDSITRIKSYLRDSKSQSEVIFSYSTDLILDDKSAYISSCLDASSSTYAELFQNLEQNHGSKVLTCQLCQNIFLNYGSFRSHVCFGPQVQGQPLKTKFMCLLCNTQLDTFLDFQKHMRQVHNTCEICFASFSSQAELAKHCSGHKQELMCMKCFMTYEDSKQFKKHLFFKHAEEAVECGVCYQKTWPWVYHFCIPVQGPMECEVCDVKLDNFAKYRVHLRTHSGIEPHTCLAKNCNKNYVSKQLLLKHHIRRHPDLRPAAAAQLEARRTQKYLGKMGASNLENVMLCQQVLIDMISSVIPYDQEPEPEAPKELEQPQPMIEQQPEPQEPEEFDPIASAVASIMGPDGAFDIRKSPVKSYPPITSPIRPPNPPPLIPLKTLPPQKPNESLLKAKEKEVDPLKMMLEKDKGRTPLPPPSEVLHPNTFHELINGNNSKKESSSDSSDDSEDSDHKETETTKEVLNEETTNPVLGGIWNQDLMFVSNAANNSDPAQVPVEEPRKKGGCKVLKPRYQIEDDKKSSQGLKTSGLKSLMPTNAETSKKSWEVLLSESSGSDNENEVPKKARIVEKDVCDKRVALKEHDYCFAVYKLARELPEKPKEDLSEMDKILSNVALGAFEPETEPKEKKKKSKKKKKKHRKKSHKNKDENSDSEVDVTNNDDTEVEKPKKLKKRKWKPKFHIPLPGASQGVTAAAARPHFSSSEGEDDELLTSGGELASSDLDTDFSADENPRPQEPELPMPLPKIKSPPILSMKPIVNKKVNKKESKKRSRESPSLTSLKLKIKLPASPALEPPLKKAKTSSKKLKKDKKQASQPLAMDAMSKKMRESLALNRASSSSSSSGSSDEDSEGGLEGLKPLTIAMKPVKQQVQPLATTNGLVATTDTKLYCVCQSPHDAVSEMIGCDAPDCKLEWFHFECVGIMVPPEGQWYCPECTKRYNIRATY